MIRKSSLSGLHSTALMAALFAITLNFLQPLALAAAVRDGAGSWTVFCKPNAEQPGDHSSPVAQNHECCLGLAQAPALVAPPALVAAVRRVATTLPSILVNDTPVSAAIRDGPRQPRAPPILSWSSEPVVHIRRCSMSFLRTAAVAALAVLAAFSAYAHDYTHGSLHIVHPWARATPPSAPAGGGYVTLTNKGASADRLVSARSAAAQKVEIHEMKMEGSVMRMRELEKGIELPAGGTVTLMPGGLHIMFMGLKAPFQKDGRVPVTLVFEKAGPIDVEFMVEAMGTQQPAPHRH